MSPTLLFPSRFRSVIGPPPTWLQKGLLLPCVAQNKQTWHRRLALQTSQKATNTPAPVSRPACFTPASQVLVGCHRHEIRLSRWLCAPRAWQSTSALQSPEVGSNLAPPAAKEKKRPTTPSRQIGELLLEPLDRWPRLVGRRLPVALTPLFLLPGSLHLLVFSTAPLFTCALASLIPHRQRPSTLYCGSPLCVFFFCSKASPPTSCILPRPSSASNCATAGSFVFPGSLMSAQVAVPCPCGLGEGGREKRWTTRRRYTTSVPLGRWTGSWVLAS